MGINDIVFFIFMALNSLIWYAFGYKNGRKEKNENAE